MRALVLAATVLGLVALAACGDSRNDVDDRTVTVYAAASLSGVFTELAEEFEARHEGVDVRLSFGGSSNLAAQITEGAPADVFAAADERTMAMVEAAARVGRGSPVVFATNTLQIAAGPGGPVRSVEDLADAKVKVVLCAPQVPCGAAASQALAAVGIRVQPVSEEQSVSDVLGKVVSGEADAGLVYRTDVLAAGDEVTGIDLPPAAQVVNRYPVLALDDAADVDLAEEFVAFVAGNGARSVLSSAGFGAP